ncbi:hypothetical protein niasHT_015286 [Heterodera trifolii]|uniref:BED-type domain-containing protein n=1 Tax=Heterodera trifolii TaxID=157864 RepID=A0ABD2L2M6_9BILA
MQKLFFPLVNLYKDNCIKLMHEKLKTQQLDTWAQLQNAILKEKEASPKIVKKLPRKSIQKQSKKQLKTNLVKGSKPIESGQVPKHPLAKDGQKCQTFLPEEPNNGEHLEERNSDIGTDFNIEYGTDLKILRPKPHKERGIDYHYFYRFDANSISCRHCPYRRPTHKRFKPTSTLKSHLKTHHLTVLEQYRRSNDILKEDSEKEQKEGGGTIKTEAKL